MPLSSTFLIRFVSGLAAVLLWLSTVSAGPLLVAYRGGEESPLDNSLPALILSASQADRIHLQLVLSRDDQLLLLGSTNLALTTDVAQRFPARQRPDGSYPCVDLLLPEIRQLRRLPASPANNLPLLAPASLDEALQLVQLLEKKLQRPLSLALEIMEPAWHRAQGKDSSQQLLAALDRHGYAVDDQRIALLSQDSDELQKLARDLLPAAGRRYQLIQVIGPAAPLTAGEVRVVPEANEWAFTQLGLRVLSTYAQAVAIDGTRLVSSAGTPLQTAYIASAKKLGLQVYVYPLATDIPPVTALAGNYPALLDFFLKTVGVDGIFTSQLADSQPPAASK